MLEPQLTPQTQQDYLEGIMSYKFLAIGTLILEAAWCLLGAQSITHCVMIRKATGIVLLGATGPLEGPSSGTS